MEKHRFNSPAFYEGALEGFEFEVARLQEAVGNSELFAGRLLQMRSLLKDYKLARQPGAEQEGERDEERAHLDRAALHRHRPRARET